MRTTAINTRLESLAPPAVPGRASNGAASALVARDLWFSYDSRTHALQGVDLAVSRGLTTMILGRSGSGKTTLLKVLAGLLRPQRGMVEVVADASYTNGRTQRRTVAYIPQTLGLVRSMTALENTLAGALGASNTLLSLFRLFPKETVGRAKATLVALGLAHKLHERVYNLSGGERQRVAIARALVQRPELILADEFVSQLDPVTAEEILDMMRQIAADGVSFLITTHETDVVAKYADRVVVMRDGQISYEGTAEGLSEGAMVGLLR